MQLNFYNIILVYTNVLLHYKCSQLHHSGGGRLPRTRQVVSTYDNVCKHSLWTLCFRRKRQAILTATSSLVCSWHGVWTNHDRGQNRLAGRRTAAVRAHGLHRCTRTATRRRTRPRRAPRKRKTKRFSQCSLCRLCVGGHSETAHNNNTNRNGRQRRRTDGGEYTRARCTSATDCRGLTVCPRLTRTTTTTTISSRRTRSDADEWTTVQWW